MLHYYPITHDASQDAQGGKHMLFIVITGEWCMHVPGLWDNISYSALYPRQQPWFKSDNPLL